MGKKKSYKSIGEFPEQPPLSSYKLALSKKMNFAVVGVVLR